MGTLITILLVVAVAVGGWYLWKHKDEVLNDINKK